MSKHCSDTKLRNNGELVTIGWSVYVCAKEQPSLAPYISHSSLTCTDDWH